MPQTKLRRFPRHTLHIAFIITLALLAASGLSTSFADMDSNKQPASEGRQLTPAETLVFDRTTRQPAVGALPVDFVRSPDKAAADGQALSRRRQQRLRIAIQFGDESRAAISRRH
jgi:hypothetical protein